MSSSSSSSSSSPPPPPPPSSESSALDVHPPVHRLSSSPRPDSPPHHRSAFTAVVSISASSVSSKTTTTTLSPTTPLTAPSRPQHGENRRLSGSSASGRSSASSQGPPSPPPPSFSPSSPHPSPSPQGYRDHSSQKPSTDGNPVYAKVMKARGTPASAVHQPVASSASISTGLKDVPQKSVPEQQTGSLHTANPAAASAPARAKQSADISQSGTARAAPAPGRLTFAGDRSRPGNTHPRGYTDTSAGNARNDKPPPAKQTASSMKQDMNGKQFFPDSMQQKGAEVASGNGLALTKPAGLTEAVSSRTSSSKTRTGQRQSSAESGASSPPLRHALPPVPGAHSASTTAAHYGHGSPVSGSQDRNESHPSHGPHASKQPSPPHHQRTDSNHTEKQPRKTTALNQQWTDRSGPGELKEEARPPRTVRDVMQRVQSPGALPNKPIGDENMSELSSSFQQPQEAEAAAAAADRAVSGRQPGHGGTAGGQYRKKALHRGGRVEKAPAEYIGQRPRDNVPPADSRKSASHGTAVTGSGVATTARDSPEPSDSSSVRMTSAVTSQTASAKVKVKAGEGQRDLDKWTDVEGRAKLPDERLGKLQVSDV